MHNKILVILVSAMITTGCAFNVAPYGASVNNVESIKSAGIKPISISTFTSSEPGKSTINCRAVGPVTVNPSFAFYIEKALIDELKLAGAYDPQSNLILEGKLVEIDFSSGITGGKWQFTLRLSNLRNESFTTTSVFNFPSSFIGERACQETAQAFSTAVQKLVQDVVTNPQFKKISD